jgi:hypothetical protein
LCGVSPIGGGLFPAGWHCAMHAESFPQLSAHGTVL